MSEVKIIMSANQKEKDGGGELKERGESSNRDRKKMLLKLKCHSQFVFRPSKKELGT